MVMDMVLIMAFTARIAMVTATLATAEAVAADYRRIDYGCIS